MPTPPHRRGGAEPGDDMKIGRIELTNPVVLAPLAGITDLPFRLLAKENGCSLVYSEMISANGLVYKSRKTEAMLRSDPAEKPAAFQIFGADPDIMARSAAKVEASGADIVDINFGCSVRKVLKTGAGAALMKDVERAANILSAVRQAVAIPVTIKMRSGWEATGEDALRLAVVAEKCGVEAIAIHPRTATQGFSGRADWRIIARLKQLVSIPVIGNGDVDSSQSALRMLTETGCDAVMIGRAAVSSPWILKEIGHLLSGKEPFAPSLAERFEVMLRYLRAVIAHYGEFQGCRILRSRLGWFTRGLPYGARFRESLKQISTRREAESCLAGYQAFLQEMGGAENER